jgi:ATP-dependent Clp protease ATP-binding subunit ClpA
MFTRAIIDAILAGKCSFEGNKRIIDTRNVIWIATSNIGDDVIPQYCGSRQAPDKAMSREEYVQLLGELKPRVFERLGVCSFCSLAHSD